MIDWLKSLSIGQVVLLVLAVLAVVTLVSALLTWVLVRRGLRTPFAIRRINRLRQWFVNLIKRPITVAVLDEVAEVLASGHYTKNISAALVENREALVTLVAEKVRDDPSTRLVGRLPGYDAVVHQVSETTLRVLIEMLSDPRMDELVSDLLRHNLDQIKEAVRDRQVDKVARDEPTAQAAKGQAAKGQEASRHERMDPSPMVTPRR
ncbi:MAG: hypothetical protein ABWY19_06195 [Marmoricola sp.]